MLFLLIVPLVAILVVPQRHYHRHMQPESCKLCSFGRTASHWGSFYRPGDDD